jgi:hypothetical protein
MKNQLLLHYVSDCTTKILATNFSGSYNTYFFSDTYQSLKFATFFTGVWHISNFHLRKENSTIRPIKVG